MNGRLSDFLRYQADGGGAPGGGAPGGGAPGGGAPGGGAPGGGAPGGGAPGGGAPGGGAPGGGAVTAWPADLSADHKAIVTAKGWKAPADLLTAYAQLESTLGREKIPLPGENAKPEEWDVVFNKLGRPEAADKYQFKPPQGVEINADLDKRFREVAWKSGASEKTAGAIYGLWNQVMGEAQTQAVNEAKAKVEQTIGALKKEWGGAYDAKLELANRVAGVAFGKDIEDARQLRLMDGSLLLDHPVIAKALAVIGAQWAEPGALPDNLNRGGFAKTPAEAKAAADRLMAQGSPYWDKSNPEHAATVARVTELMKIAHPDEAAA